jgi:D-amino-acid dehydrogenase
MLIDRGEPERAASFGNSGQFAVGEIIPLSVPGVLFQVPKWLLDPLGPLTIRWRDLPMLTPWLLRFIAASRPARVAAISSAMTELCDRMHRDYAPLLDLTGTRAIIRDMNCIKLYRTRADWEAEAKIWAMRKKAGLEYELLDAAALKRLDPAISDHSRFGVEIVGRTYISNLLRMMQAFAATITARGGEIVTGEVSGFEVTGGRLHGVKLHDGRRLPASAAVIAAGIESRALCRLLGDAVPLVAERGYHFMLPEPKVEVRRSYTIGWAGMGIVPMERGLRLGGTVELADSAAPPNFARAERLFENAVKVFPGLSRDGATRWCGNRPSLPDSLPVIDRATKVDNVIYAFGHGHMGVGWAATTGKAVAALHSRERPDLDLAPFKVTRFS